MLTADTCLYRFIVLFFNCMLTFGSYYCFDMPSVLQDEFQGQPCTANGTNEYSNNSTCCSTCLGMTPEQYNLLYAIYAWTNALVVVFAGLLIDKLGNRVGLFLFTMLCVAGSSLFALGATYPGTSLMLPLMLTGRLLFGAGNGSLTIVQNRITSIWFRNKELAMAFGITLAFSRLGSVLNFLLTERFADHFGLRWTLWGGAMLCGLGMCSAVILNILDYVGMRQLGMDTAIKEDSKKVKVSDILQFSLQFWLLALTLMFFYNGVFPFIADASDFIHTKYNTSRETASYIAGSAYDVSMILSPVLGIIIDHIGLRGVFALGCALFTLPVYGLLAFTYTPPLVCILLLGLTYSIAAASTWPSIPLVVSRAYLGTALGVTGSMQMIGIGVCNLVVGAILGSHDSSNIPLSRWKYMMIFMFTNTVACCLCALALNYVDRRRDHVLNQSRSERIYKENLRNIQESAPESEQGSTGSQDDEPLLPGENRRTANIINDRLS